MTDLLTHFKKKYQADVGESPKRLAVRRPIYNDWRADYEFRAIYATHEYEQAIEVTLSRDAFVKLMEADYYYEQESRDHDYNRKIVDMLRADERIRCDNPAVDKAYKKYLMLLELARK